MRGLVFALLLALASVAQASPPLDRLGISGMAIEADTTKPTRIDGGRIAPRRWLTLVVELKAPKEEGELRMIASVLRLDLADVHALALRFVLPGWPRKGLDPEVGQPFYAWFLHRAGQPVIFTVNGQPDSVIAKSLAVAKMDPGEVIERLWVDRYSVLGLVGLARNAAGERRYVRFLPDVVERYTLRQERAAPQRYVAVDKIDADGKRWRADGNGTDSVAIEITADGRLLEFGGGRHLASKPWLVAEPIVPPQRP